MTSIRATPDTLTNIIKAAKGGETIRLQPGDYGRVRLSKRAWSKRVTVHANRVRVLWSLDRVEGLTIYGGIGRDAMGSGPDGYVVQVTNCRQISIFDMELADSNRGIVFSGCQDVIARRNRISGMAHDGIDVALTQRAKVQDNDIRDFRPALGAHADGIQMWSRPGQITSDVLIEGNTLFGEMQGITGFNHVRDGVDDGGFDHIVILNNDVEVGHPQGIALYDARDSEISGNALRTLPGSTSRASLNIVGGTVTAERNTVGPKQ